MLRRFLSKLFKKQEKFKFVKQLDDNGCLIAVIAMLVGRDYDYVKSRVPEPNKNGLRVSECVPFCIKEGYWIGGLPFLQDNGAVYEDGRIPDIMTIDSDTVLSSPCILTVRLYPEHSYHSVLWNGKRIYDPAEDEMFNPSVSFYHIDEIHFIRKL